MLEQADSPDPQDQTLLKVEYDKLPLPQASSVKRTGKLSSDADHGNTSLILGKTMNKEKDQPYY